jgi:hypothetical protein
VLLLFLVFADGSQARRVFAVGLRQATQGASRPFQLSRPFSPAALHHHRAVALVVAFALRPIRRSELEQTFLARRAPSSRGPRRRFRAPLYSQVSSARELYREEFYTYRPTVKLVDVTIRDGGLMNKWQFSDELVRAVYEANIAAGVDYMEIGYLTSESYFKRTEVGPWRFCADADLRRVIGENKTGLKISVMADIGRVDDCDIPPVRHSLALSTSSASVCVCAPRAAQLTAGERRPVLGVSDRSHPRSMLRPPDGRGDPARCVRASLSRARAACFVWRHSSAR